MTNLAHQLFSENPPETHQNQNSMPKQGHAGQKNIFPKPPVIHMETNYKLFVPHDLQRKLQDRNLNNLRESVKKHNVLHENPITVIAPSGDVIPSEENPYLITNGNHRFTISKEIGYPIYFIVSLDFQHQDIINTGFCLSKWAHLQFTDFYCKKGKQEYIKFRKFYQDFHLDVNTALRLTRRPVDRGSLNDDFRNGNFVFYGEQERRREVDEACQFLNACITSGLAYKKHFTNSNFFDGYIKLMDHPKYDFKTIIDKVTHGKIKIGMLPHFSSHMLFYNCFKYNFLGIKPEKEI